MILTQLAGALALGAATWQLSGIDRVGDLATSLGLQLLLLAITGAAALSGRLAQAAPLLLGVTFPVVLLYWAVLPYVIQFNESPGTKLWVIMAVLTAVVVLTGRGTGRPVLLRIYQSPLFAAAALVGLSLAVCQYFVFRHFRFASSEALPELLNVIITLLVIAPLVWGLGLRQPHRRWLLLGWVVSQGIWWFSLVRNLDEFPGDGRWLLLLCIPTAVLAAACALRPDPAELVPGEVGVAGAAEAPDPAHADHDEQDPDERDVQRDVGL